MIRRDSLFLFAICFHKPDCLCQACGMDCCPFALEGTFPLIDASRNEWSTPTLVFTAVLRWAGSRNPFGKYPMPRPLASRHRYSYRGTRLVQEPLSESKDAAFWKYWFFWKKNTFCFVFKVDVILPIIYKKNQNALQIDWTSRIMLCAIYLWKAKQKVIIYEEFWQMVMGSPDPYVCCSRSAVKHCNGNVQPTLGVARTAVHGAASDSLFM